MMLKVSENMVLYWKHGQLICDNFVRHKQYALSPLAEPLLRWFANWKDIDSLGELEHDEILRSRLKNQVQRLLDAGILIAQDSEENQLEEKLRAWDVWRQPAKYYHSSVRTVIDTEFLSREENGQQLVEKAQRIPPPPLYKEYPQVLHVPLSVPEHFTEKEVKNKQSDNFINILLRRRTTRVLDSSKSITFDQLSALLYYVFGATHTANSVGTGKILLKTSPSGGARHPIEVYPCILRVDGIDPGLYHYNVKMHELELLVQHDFQNQFKDFSGGQAWTTDASALFFYTAMVERSMWKYPSPRVYRVIMMDLGHLSQTFFLTSVWLGLGAFFIGALREESVEQVLGLDWTKEIVLGASGVGISALEARAEGPNVEQVVYRP